MAVNTAPSFPRKASGAVFVYSHRERPAARGSLGGGPFRTMPRRVRIARPAAHGFRGDGPFRARGPACDPARGRLRAIYLEPGVAGLAIAASTVDSDFAINPSFPGVDPQLEAESEIVGRAAPLVGRPGLEPGTLGLKVPCSTR